MAKQLLDKAVKAAGELGQSMLEEAQKHAAEVGEAVKTEYDAAKKGLDDAGNKAKGTIEGLVEDTKKHVEAAIAKAQELQAHGKAAADKAYAWAKDEAEQAIAQAQAVFAECEKAYNEAKDTLEKLKAEVGEKAEAGGRAVVDQAKAAYDMAKQLLDKAVAAAGELGQSMLEDAKKHADEMAKEAQTGLDAAKKELQRFQGTWKVTYDAYGDKVARGYVVDAAIRRIARPRRPRRARSSATRPRSRGRCRKPRPSSSSARTPTTKRSRS